MNELKREDERITVWRDKYVEGEKKFGYKLGVLDDVRMTVR
jgi:hypothetical protein